MCSGPHIALLLNHSGTLSRVKYKNVKRFFLLFLMFVALFFFSGSMVLSFPASGAARDIRAGLFLDLLFPRYGFVNKFISSAHVNQSVGNALPARDHSRRLLLGRRLLGPEVVEGRQFHLRTPVNNFEK